MKREFEKLAQIRSDLPDAARSMPSEDEFLTSKDLVPAFRQAAENRIRMALGEISELQRENRWQEIVDLFSPVGDKLPEIVDSGLDVPLREKLAFALGHLGRYDDAIAELESCVEREPDRFHLHSALAYNAYNSLFAAKNREIFLSGKVRRERIKLAHRHFLVARELRPDGVTNFYRHGMLYHRIEEKPEKAVPLFAGAVENWDRLYEAERETRHQERKNFIKSLYQSASALSAIGRFELAKTNLKRCLKEDENTEYLSMLHKYFALGKIEFHLNRFNEARNALLFAEKCRKTGEPVDFVYELLARVYLVLKDAAKALAVIDKVPEKFRRPYYRWTEADALCALGRYDRAKQVLNNCCERDRRSRHKGLLRISKIEYLLGDYIQGAKAAEAADRFFREKWGNAYRHGLFWQALNTCRAGDIESAKRIATTLRDLFPGYPKLDRLFALMEEKDGG